MSIVKTDLRVTRERAQQLRFYPAGGITATDVQRAIEQAAALPSATTPSYIPTVVTFAMSPYTPVGTDTVLLVNTSAGAVVINMPLSAARSGVPLIVKDDTGNAAVNAIAINRAGAELIDGRASYPVDSSFTSVNLQPKAVGGYDVV